MARRRRCQTPKPVLRGDRWRIVFRRDVAQPDGSIAYKQTSITLGGYPEMTRAEAQRAALKLIEPINEVDPAVEHSRRTMSDLIDRWRQVASPELKLSTQLGYKWAFKRIERAFGEVEVSAIAKSDVKRFLRACAQELASISVHNLRVYLSGLFSFAEDEEWLRPGANPAKGKLRGLPPKRNSRKKILLSPVDYRRLAAALPQPYSGVVMLAVLTGLRAGEVAALRWRNISGCTITIEQAVYRGKLDSPKSEKSAEEVGIGPLVQQALEDWRKVAKFTAPDDFVFAVRTNTPLDMHNVAADYLKPTARKLGLGNLSWHDLRHTFCTLGRRAGVEPEEMREMMRHRSVSTTLDIYSHLAEDKAAIAARIEGFAWPETELPVV